jgi:hypothetical protein
MGSLKEGHHMRVIDPWQLQITYSVLIESAGFIIAAW